MVIKSLIDKEIDDHFDNQIKELPTNRNSCSMSDVWKYLDLLERRVRELEKLNDPNN